MPLLGQSRSLPLSASRSPAGAQGSRGWRKDCSVHAELMTNQPAWRPGLRTCWPVGRIPPFTGVPRLERASHDARHPAMVSINCGIMAACHLVTQSTVFLTAEARKTPEEQRPQCPWCPHAGNEDRTFQALRPPRPQTEGECVSVPRNCFPESVRKFINAPALL